DRLDVSFVVARESGLTLGELCRCRARIELSARPDADAVVAMAAQRREPAAVVRDDALPFTLRIVEGEKTDAHLALLGKLLEHALEIVEVADRLAVNLRDQ